MTTSSNLVATLKRQLKARGLTYHEVAARLGLSESAVKHMFSSRNFSLKRLDELCDVLELDFADLVGLSESLEPRIEELPAEHESEIVSDPRLLLLAYCLVNYWTFDEVVRKYDITPADGRKYLRRLDQMKVIELLPGDRIRLLISNNFRWRRNGAIEQYFTRHVQADFLRGDFTADSAIRIAKNGMLSKRGQALLREKLRAIGELFDEETWQERRMPVSEQQGITMVLAMRHWSFDVFRELEREDDGVEQGYRRAN